MRSSAFQVKKGARTYVAEQLGRLGRDRVPRPRILTCQPPTSEHVRDLPCAHSPPPPFDIPAGPCCKAPLRPTPSYPTNALSRPSHVQCPQSQLSPEPDARCTLTKDCNARAPSPRPAVGKYAWAGKSEPWFAYKYSQSESFTRLPNQRCPG